MTENGWFYGVKSKYANEAEFRIKAIQYLLENDLSDYGIEDVSDIVESISKICSDQAEILPLPCECDKGYCWGEECKSIDGVNFCKNGKPSAIEFYGIGF